MYPFIKRTTDMLAVITLLFLLAPILAITALLVRIRLGSPVLFRQERAGQFGRPFRIIKFRTMTDARDAEGQLLSDEVRFTRFGQLLRSCSLDELPQLFNVALGQMSLVGPRPLHTTYTPRYNSLQKRRLLVLPGITGLAQINGRNALSWDEKFALDTRYVDTASIMLDLKILILTIEKVICRSNVSQNGHATMPEFLGSRDEHG